MNCPTKVVVDLNKVQYARLYYKNQHGVCSDYLPKEPTVRGKVIKEEFAMPHHDYPLETMLERAHRLMIVDNWIPHCYLQLTANHSLTFHGKRALSIWQAWSAKIFSKCKTKRKKK